MQPVLIQWAILFTTGEGGKGKTKAGVCPAGMYPSIATFVSLVNLPKGQEIFTGKMALRVYRELSLSVAKRCDVFDAIVCGLALYQRRVSVVRLQANEDQTGCL